MGLLFDSYVLDVLVALVTLAFVFYKYFTPPSNYWKDRGIPSVKPSEVSGGLDSLLGRKPFYELHNNMYNSQPDASCIGYFEFTKPALIIRDPALVEKVLISDFGSFHDRGLPYDVEREPLTGTLFNVEGSYWRNLRYKLTPVFTTGKLKSMAEQMSNSADNLVKHMEKELQVNSGTPLEATQLIRIFSVDVICSCAFGLDCSKESEEGKDFRKMVTQIMVPSKMLLWTLIFLSLFPKLAKLLKIKNFKPEVSDYFTNLTKETIKYRRTNGVKRNDFVQLLMKLQEQEQNDKDGRNEARDDAVEEDGVLNQLENAPVYENNLSTTKIFTDECLAAQSFSFLSAGSEAITMVTSYCLYALGDNLYVQEKLQKEVDSILLKHNGNLTYEAVKEMKYLDQVFSETQRLYSPVALITRKCNKPFQVPDTKSVIEPGTSVHIPVYALHHDEKYFPDPFTFNPERFAEGNTMRKGTYLPFGDGPRICIVFTDECLAAQSFTFLTVGSEVIALVGSSCLHVLADNLHVQDKLQKEVDSILQKHNGNLTCEAVKEMKYLDQILNETLRIYPVVAVLVRKCTKPFQVPDTYCVIEPGTTVRIPVYALHHDEKYYPDPYTFNPERFAEGNTIHKGTYLPFGDGPRICIGMRFAQLEIKLCVARIVSTFNIRVNKKTIQAIEFNPESVFVEPKGGMWLDFEKRDKA